MNYNLEKDKLAFQKQAASGSSQDLMSVSEGTTIFNPATGKPIYTAPKTYAPSTGGTSGTSGGAAKYISGGASSYIAPTNPFSKYIVNY